MNADRSNWPLMVRLGLWKVPTRSAAWIWFWISTALAIGLVAYGMVYWPFLFGGLLLLASLWYYMSIRWVDQHGSW